MIDKITKGGFGVAVKKLEAGDGDGVVWHSFGQLDDGRELCLVFGYVEGYDSGELYQKKIGDTLYTLCAKIAVNIDDLQCDYDMDWYMPWSKATHSICDTEMAISDFEDYAWYNKEAEYIMEAMNQGKLVVE